MWQGIGMKDFEQSFVQAADATGNVSESNVMDLLADAMTLGETSGQSEESGAPNADDTTTKPEDTPAAPAPAPAAPPADAPNADPEAVPEGKTPVVLAKDGIHTIGYDKLVEARSEAATAKAERDRLAAQLAELQARPAPAPAPAAPAAAPAAEAGPDAPLFGDYSDEALKKGVQTLLDQQAASLRAEFEGKLKPVEVDRAVQAQQAHLATIYAAHPDADSITASEEFARWEKSQPAIVQRSITQVLDKGGSAVEVNQVLDMYRAAHPRQAPASAATPAAPAAAPAAAKPTAQALADKAIADAKDRTPTTLSDIPAGSQAVQDEAAAMVQATPMDLIDKLSSMSPEQIEAWQARYA